METGGSERVRRDGEGKEGGKRRRWDRERGGKHDFDICRGSSELLVTPLC